MHTSLMAALLQPPPPCMNDTIAVLAVVLHELREARRMHTLRRKRRLAMWPKRWLGADWPPSTKAQRVVVERWRPSGEGKYVDRAMEQRFGSSTSTLNTRKRKHVDSEQRANSRPKRVSGSVSQRKRKRVNSG